MKKALFILFGFWALVALFAEFLANDDPILYTYNGDWRCGVCHEWLSVEEHRTPEAAKALVNPPVRYDASTLEPAGYILLPPLSEGTKGVHLLGTDSQSRDLLAGIIFGARYALLIAILSTFFAGLMGIFAGIAAGYYGNRHYRMHPAILGLWLLGIAYAFFLHHHELLPLWASIAFLLLSVIWPFFKGSQNSKNVMVPLDSIVTKGIEVIDSLPALFVLLAWVASMAEWNVLSLSLLIAFFRWPAFARLSRIEINRWKSGDWVNILKSLRMSDRWIIGRQLSELILVPLSVHAAFVAAGAVSIEATLSFLGFGLGAEVVSWGSLLNEARQFFHAWWLIIFPGLCLFSLLWGFNQLARRAQIHIQRSRLKPPENIL